MLRKLTCVCSLSLLVLAGSNARSAPQGRGSQRAAVGAKVEALVDQLKTAKRPEKRRSAVKKLAAMGGELACEAVFLALEDRDGQVADTAQILLAGLDGDGVLSAALGKQGLRHRNAWVRLRVAEALGRWHGPIAIKALTKRLSVKDDQVAGALLWSIERLHGRGELDGDFAKAARRVEACLARNAPPELRARALFTAELLAPDLKGRRLRKGLRDRDAQVRSAALLGLELHAVGAGAAGQVTLLKEASRSAGDIAPGTRMVASAVLGRIRTPAALGVLVDRLGLEERTAVKASLLRILQQTTGLRYRLDPRPWRQFLESMDPAERIEGVVAGDRGEANRSSSSAEGFPVHSDRAAFLVDLSGSVWNQREDGRTRKQLVDDMLESTLESLPEDSFFNVTAYTADLHPWRQALCRARRKHTQSAMAFFRELRVTGPGDVWTATQASFLDPDLDTIVLVTDGAPTGGQRWDLDLMLELFAQETRWRPIRFDVVLIDSSPRLVKRWQSLADRTGGTCTEIHFRAQGG